MIEILGWDPDKAIDAFDLSRGHKQVVVSGVFVSSNHQSCTGEIQLLTKPKSQRMGKEEEKVLHSRLFLRMDVNIQGGFFNWSAQKMTKCQITCKSLQKSSKCQNFQRVWHLVIFRADQ